MFVIVLVQKAMPFGVCVTSQIQESEKWCSSHTTHTNTHTYTHTPSAAVLCVCGVCVCVVCVFIVSLSGVSLFWSTLSLGDWSQKRTKRGHASSSSSFGSAENRIRSSGKEKITTAQKQQKMPLSLFYGEDKNRTTTPPTTRDHNKKRKSDSFCVICSDKKQKSGVWCGVVWSHDFPFLQGKGDKRKRSVRLFCSLLFCCCWLFVVGKESGT